MPDLEVAVLAGHDQPAARRTAARRTGRSGSPSGCPGRSSSCGGRRRAAAISEPSARPSLIVHSTAVRFGTGQRPGVREADRAGAGVLRGAEARLAAAEHLRPRLQVDVDLEPDHRLPVVIAAAPGRSRSRARARARARRGRACSPRTAGRSAGGRRAAPPRARTGSRGRAGRPCTTGS